MGVPKFCRYICERYPCILELINEYQMPDFDYLYLDLNGIVHCCSHPNDADAGFRISEEDIFKNIFQYIEILFNMIKPRKLFFMAVDGVAPRAKINQQRGRRFRTAKEAEAAEARARARGDTLPEGDKFDSNCITPGTEFMEQLAGQLQYFVKCKMATNKLWQNCKVLLSGPEVPGEGEHKIMDFIRYMKSSSDYDPNTRHCLYGLDADLIILALCTHEPHFSVLREEVKYGRVQNNKKITSPDKIRFCLLHVSLLRDYLEHEFSALKGKISFPFDVEKIIDDWILMGFLVGNDFIPNLPNLHIEHGALPILFQTYIDVLPTLDGYINESGDLILARFEKFMDRLSKLDTEKFAEHFAVLKYFESKTGRRPNEMERTSYAKSKDSPDNFASPKKLTNKELNALIKSTDDMLIGHYDEEELLDVEDSDSEMYNIEFMQHKRHYYMDKMEYEEVDAEVLRSQAESYVIAIQWNLHYYYHGCCSWSWYYPHHYAPYISDIKNFKDFKIEFEMGQPFLPFQQLLAVLPAASKKLLPEVYQGLLTDPESPIIDYYPTDFKTDLNNKKQEWEAIVLIPFIDPERLLAAMEPYNSKLTPEERKRNEPGVMRLFQYDPDADGSYEAPKYFPSVKDCTKFASFRMEDIIVPREKLIKGLHKDVNLDIYFAGFPTLRFIEHTAKLEDARVKVYEAASRYENMMLTILPRKIPNLHDLASKLLGKTVFVSWPHMREALVIGVSSLQRKITLVNKNKEYSPDNVWIEDLSTRSHWFTDCSTVADGYKGRFGIYVGEISVLVYALPMVGRQYILTNSGSMSLEKTWAPNPLPYAYQAVITEISLYESNHTVSLSLSDVYTPKSVVFMLGHPHYGAMGEVIEPAVNIKTGRIKVAMRILNEPNLEPLQRQYKSSTTDQWMMTNTAAQRLGLSKHFLSRITGSIYVMLGTAEAPEGGKQNVGLNLKFKKRNEEVPGYTKKDMGQWLYSMKTIGLIRDFMIRYPVLFERLALQANNDIYTEYDLFDNSPENLSDVVSWIKEQPFSNIEARSCNSVGVDGEVLEKIKNVIDRHVMNQESNTGNTVIMQVKPHLLFKPGLNSGNLPPDQKAQHKLFDRIISIKENFAVPLGYKGTIVNMHKCDEDTDFTYDIFFDREFTANIFCGNSTVRRYKLQEGEFINISYGIRVEQSISSVGGGEKQQPKSWRKETAETKKLNVGPPVNVRNIPLPAFCQNFNATDVKQPGQIRVMKKNENFANRASPPGKIKVGQVGNFIKGEKSNVVGDRKLTQSTPNVGVDKNSEFQMLWNELHKPGVCSANTGYRPTPMMPPGLGTQKQISGSGFGDTERQDESALLKAMLKIPDENSSNSLPTGIAKASVSGRPVATELAANQAPPLVQRLFDQARQASRQDNVSYCARLLTHSQLTWRGMPRYNYLSNRQKMVCAQIILPDMKTYCGEFCTSHAEAADSAAKIVCQKLNIDSGVTPSISVLGAPPQMWLNSRPNDVAPQHHNTRTLPMMQPQSPQVFPNMHNPPMHIGGPSQWNPLMQPAFPQHPPQHPPARPPMQQQQQQRPPNMNPNINPIQPQQNFSQTVKNTQNISRTDTKPENNKTKPSTPFVPLQAQKKKNAKPKQAPRHQNQNSKDVNQAAQPSPSREEPPKDDKSSGNERKDQEPKKPPQVSQKIQRPPRQRRSRIAANFNSTPAANGSGPQ